MVVSQKSPEAILLRMCHECATIAACHDLNMSRRVCVDDTRCVTVAACHNLNVSQSVHGCHARVSRAGEDRLALHCVDSIGHDNTERCNSVSCTRYLGAVSATQEYCECKSMHDRNPEQCSMPLRPNQINMIEIPDIAHTCSRCNNTQWDTCYCALINQKQRDCSHCTHTCKQLL